MTALATDPPVSEAQKRAMFSAAAGHSKIGIPKKVGQEFVGAKDMSREDMSLLRRLLNKFFGEEAEESEHQGNDALPGKAASVAFVTPDGLVLLLKRAPGERNFPDTWALPGGQVDGDETPQDCAMRECGEEIGGGEYLWLQHLANLESGAAQDKAAQSLTVFDQVLTPRGWQHTTFIAPVREAFEPTLNDEHTAHQWAPVTDLPEPMHPGVKASVERFLSGVTGDIAAPTLTANASVPSGMAREPDPDPVRVQAADLALDWSGRIGLRETAAEPIQAMACDRDSVRTYDNDGRLHVARSNISKANICEYLGAEINAVMAGSPGWTELAPDRKYRLLRAPDELEKAASTFNGLPILSQHIPVTADAHKSEYVIGATGNEAEFAAPYLTNALTIWPQSAIDGIESKRKTELSPGYKYRADMTPGTYDGTSYDGVMRDIIGNHLALVVEGRSGTDVVVADAMPLDPAWLAIERAVLALV